MQFQFVAIENFDKYMHQNGKGPFEKALNMIDQRSLPILCKHDVQETWAVDKLGYKWITIAKFSM